MNDNFRNFQEKISASRSFVSSDHSNKAKFLESVEHDLLPLLKDFAAASKYIGLSALLSEDPVYTTPSEKCPVGPSFVYQSEFGRSWSFRLVYDPDKNRLFVLHMQRSINSKKSVVSFAQCTPLNSVEKEEALIEYFDYLSDCVGKIQAQQALTEEKRNIILASYKNGDHYLFIGILILSFILAVAAFGCFFFSSYLQIDQNINDVIPVMAFVSLLGFFIYAMHWNDVRSRMEKNILDIL